METERNAAAFQASELRRAWNLGCLGACALYLLAVVTAVVVGVLTAGGTTTGFIDPRWVTAMLVGLAALPPLTVALMWRRLRSRLMPVAQVNSLMRQWRDEDVRQAVGEPYPVSPDEAIDRLGTRADDAAVLARTWFLFDDGRLNEARAVLDVWEPIDPIAFADRARLMSTLAHEAGETGDLDGARRAADAIQDPAQRARRHAAILLEEGRRLSGTGDPQHPFEAAALLEAHGLLTETDEACRYRVGMRRYLTIVAVAPTCLYLALLVWSGLLPSP